MTTLEELRNKWNATPEFHPGYDASSLEKIIRTRVSKHLNTSMQYFWASFALQMLVYSMLSHVIVKYRGDSEMLLLGSAGILLFVPFTTILLRRFKKLASAKPLKSENTVHSVYDYVIHQQSQLQSFYNFKKWYEFVLIPLSSAIGVFLVFKLYVPGGIAAHWAGATMVFVVTLSSCVTAIISENRKSFRKPLQELQLIVEEFRESE